MAGGGGGRPMKREDFRKKITSVVIASTVGLCFADTLVTISLKIQGTTYGFKHSGIQTMFVFLGEYFNLIAFGLPLLVSNRFRTSHFQGLVKEAKASNPPMNLRFTKLWAALPCLLECLSSCMYFTSLLLLPASISNMLQGAQIVATCLFSKWINNNPILLHHKLGIGLAIIGFIFVGIAGYSGALGETFNDLHYTTEGYIIGLLCILGNLIFHSVQTNIEERIMRVNAIPPQRIVGLEGLFGMIWMLTIIAGLNFVPCPNDQLCYMGGYLEDFATGMNAILADPGLAFWCAATIFAIFFFNLFGMILIQRVNAVYKVFWDNTLSIFVWATAVLVGFETIDKEHFAVQMTGYAFLIIGNLTYSELIRWRFWHLDRDIFDFEVRQERISLRKSLQREAKLRATLEKQSRLQERASAGQLQRMSSGLPLLPQRVDRVSDGSNR